MCPVLEWRIPRLTLTFLGYGAVYEEVVQTAMAAVFAINPRPRDWQTLGTPEYFLRHIAGEPTLIPKNCGWNESDCD